MLKKLTAIAILGSVLTVMGCETVPNTATTQTANHLQLLQNRTWIATQIGNTEIKTAPTAHNVPSLQFDASTQRVSGSDSCNRIMGSYTAAKDTLTLSQMATTRMACMNNDQLDQKFNDGVISPQEYSEGLKALESQNRQVQATLRTVWTKRF